MHFDELAIALKVQDKLNVMRIRKHYLKNVPQYLRSTEGVDITIINPQNDCKDFYNQPLVVIPVADYLAQLQSFELKTKPNRKLKEAKNG